MTRRWLASLLALLSLLSIGAGLFAYTGPGDRTIATSGATCWRVKRLSDLVIVKNSCHEDEIDPYRGNPAYRIVAYAGSTTTTYSPASLSKTFNCALPGNAGWCRNGAFTISGSEPMPGEVITVIEADATGTLCALNSASGSCAWSPADGEASVFAWAASSFGDTSLAQTLAWKIDRTAPTLTLHIPVPDGQNGWYISAPTLGLMANDATSGLASASFDTGGNSAMVMADGTTTLTASALDVAGNTSTQSVTIRKDSTPPTLSIPTAPDGDNGWYVTQPTITLLASDAVSGLASASFDGGGQTVTLADGVFVLNATVSDNAGNTWAVAETVRVDTQAPVLNPALSTAPASHGWHTSAVTVAANAAEAVSCLASVEYRLDGGAWQSGSSVTVASEGDHAVEFRATDNAGNQALSAPQRFRLDATPPTSAFANPPEGATTKISGAFTFSGASADVLSGLAAAEISLDNGSTWQPLTLSAGSWSYTWDTRAVRDGSYTILVRAADRAGNRENTARVQVVIGNQPPRVDIQPSWWLWEAGRVRVRAMDIPIQEVTVQISCSPWHQDLILHYTAETAPAEIEWDRLCGEGAYAAESGDYPVTVTACDTWERCTAASGVIRVPLIAPPVPTSTPTAQPTGQPTPTARPKQPSPTPMATQITLPSQEPPAEPPAAPQPAAAAWRWSLMVLPGLWMVFGLNSLTDPRPAALRRLGQSLKKVSDHK